MEVIPENAMLINEFNIINDVTWWKNRHLIIWRNASCILIGYLSFYLFLLNAEF